MKKGREDAWGGTPQESMMVFYGEGLKLQQEQKYGVHGKFYTDTCTSTGKLVCWYEQHPIEVLNAIHLTGSGTISPIMQQLMYLRLEFHLWQIGVE